MLHIGKVELLVYVRHAHGSSPIWRTGAVIQIFRPLSGNGWYAASQNNDTVNPTPIVAAIPHCVFFDLAVTSLADIKH